MIAERQPRRNDQFLSGNYERVVPTEFSSEESLIRALPLEFSDIAAVLGPKGPWRAYWRSIVVKTGSDALRAIEKMVITYVVQRIEHEKGISPELKEKAIRVIKIKDEGKVNKNSPEHFAMRELAMRSNRLKLNLVFIWVTGGGGKGFDSVERLEFEHLTPALAAVDILYIKLVTEPSPIDSEERKRRGMTNEGSVVRGKVGEEKEVPMHEAYPEESTAIAVSYRTLINSLTILLSKTIDRKMRDRINRKIKYYKAVLLAFETSDPSDWRKADE